MPRSNRSPRSAPIVVLVLVVAIVATARAEAPDGPMAFFEPFIGDWGMDPESEMARTNPERRDDVAFRLEWADPGKKILRFYEGIPNGDLEQRVLENLVTANPRTGEVVAVGYQLRNDFFYESTFSPMDQGFVREYRVTYPPEQEFRHEEDRERGWILYRDRCVLTAPDRLHCITEQRRDGAWQPWQGNAEGYELVRR